MSDKEIVFKFYRKIGSVLFFHLIGFILSGMALVLFGEYQETWILILSISILITAIASLIFSFRSWNYVIYVDSNGFWYEKQKEKFELNWEEIDIVERKTGYGRFNTMIVSNKDMTKKITFEYGHEKKKE